MNDTLMTNKNFIKVCTVLGVFLALLVFVLFINELKASKYVGRGESVSSTISVTADGEVTAVPDIATLSFTVSKDATTAKEAQNLLNADITKVLEYIKKQNIADKDVKSEYGGVTPKYAPAQNNIVCVRYPCEVAPVVVGYTASQSISIKVRAVDTGNEIRTGLASLGVTNISGPTFSIDDEEVLKDLARSKAIEKAKEKAEVLAKELGVHLGGVVSFSENTGGNYPMMYAKAGMMDSAVASAPSLPKGENKVSTTVTITYEIK